MLSQPQKKIKVIEGVDELCWRCYYYADERCHSPLGDEEEVRKWDAILLKELGIPAGTCLTVDEWQKLINQKAPFKICRKCQWKKVCSIGQK